MKSIMEMHKLTNELDQETSKFQFKKFLNSNSILECTDISERVLLTPWYSVGKLITFTFTLQLVEW